MNRLTEPGYLARKNPGYAGIIAPPLDAIHTLRASLPPDPRPPEASRDLGTPPGVPLLRAGIYIRISLEKEDPENQKHRAIKECEEKRWAWAPDRIYMDTEHGDVISRDGLRRCLLEARAKQFDILVVWSLDRLTRGGPDALFEALSVLKEIGVKWHSITDPIPKVDDPFLQEVIRDVLVFGIGLGSKLYLKTVSQNTKNALDRRKAMGQKLGRPKGAKDSYVRVKRWMKKPADADSFRSLLRPVPPPS